MGFWSAFLSPETFVRLPGAWIGTANLHIQDGRPCVEVDYLEE